MNQAGKAEGLTGTKMNQAGKAEGLTGIKKDRTNASP